MHIGVPAEIRGGETRVAATPETVKKFTANGLNAVLVQSGAGAGARTGAGTGARTGGLVHGG